MSQKTDNMIKLALVFFVSLLSFSIGTYVGKKYSDNQYKLSLLEPKKETAPHAESQEFAADTATVDTEKATAEETVAAGAKPTTLSDSEVAKIAEEFASEEDSTEGKVLETVAADEKPVGTTEDKKVGKLANKAATQAAVEKIKQMETPERDPASISARKEVVPVQFTVQIGAFPTAEEAQKMTSELQSKGYKTTSVPVTIKGQVWHRVNVGLFGSAKEANDYKKDFLEKTKLSSAFVQRVQ